MVCFSHLLNAALAELSLQHLAVRERPVIICLGHHLPWSSFALIDRFISTASIMLGLSSQASSLHQ
jgi:hypothetical protein